MSSLAERAYQGLPHLRQSKIIDKYVWGCDVLRAGRSPEQVVHPTFTKGDVLTKRMASVAVLAVATIGLGALGVVQTASAGEQVCYTTVHPHTYPGVINDPQNGIGVETGEYHLHTNCT